MMRAHLRSTRRPLALLASLTLLGLFLPGCGDSEHAGHSGAAAPTSSDAPTEDGVAVLGSLPDFSLTDENGEPFGKTDLEGALSVSDFIFTTCPDMCPMLTREMAKLQQVLQEDPALRGVQLVSFSVDPETDTPEALIEYAERHDADLESWSFVTGARSALMELIEGGFKLPVMKNADSGGSPFLHSDKFVVADSQGRIRGYYSALEPEGRNRLVADLRSLVMASPASAAELSEAEGAPMAQVVHPPAAANPSWLASRGAAQREAIAKSSVFHDFGFTDRSAESGITFQHQIVEDSGVGYRGVHYDHGNGVSIADIDGDGLHDIYFTSQLGSNGMWRNLGGGKFEDFVWQAGVNLFDRISVSSTFADTDNDGDPDLYVTTVRGPNVLYENDGKGHFKDVSAASGLEYAGHSSGAVFFDYNRDGLLDLFLVNVGVYTETVREAGGYYVGFKDGFSGHLKPERSEASVLYENQGGNRFVDVSEKVGLVDTRWSGDATPVDFNEDGWIDLYVPSMQGLDEYWENVGGKSFRKRADELFPRTSWGAMGVKSFDFENDGDLDLFTTDMHSDMVVDDIPIADEKLKNKTTFPPEFLVDDGRGIRGNSFFRNDGEAGFTEISDEIGAENFWPWGLSVGDLNADGFSDAFIASSMNYPFRYGVNSVLLNEAGKRFVDAEFALGVEPRSGGPITPWFELDCSVYHFICTEYGQKGRVQVMGAKGTRSSVLFDLDQDGDLDIVTNEFGAKPLVLISDLSEKQPLHFLKVELTGTKSNRDGLGARVRVHAGSDTYTQVQDGVSGYLSHSLYPLYYGLGSHEKVDRIEVEWPSGARQTLEGPLEINRLLEIREAS